MSIVQISGRAVSDVVTDSISDTLLVMGAIPLRQANLLIGDSWSWL